MTSLLTTMRERLAEAESDADRLRAAIQILEQAEPSPRVKRTRAAATAAPATAAPAAPVTPATAAAPAATAAAAAPAPRKRKAAPKKAAKAVVPLEKLLKVVGDKPGMTTTSIAKETGGDQSVLLELLKESEQKGEVRRQGQRRATSWYLITDEDRIAARAAQIAAQAKSGGGRKAPAKPTRRRAAATG
jgi:pyruvate dehydrogenase E2 component (dihydrolipoamide acetyltransferase)